MRTTCAAAARHRGARVAGIVLMLAMSACSAGRPSAGSSPQPRERQGTSPASVATGTVEIRLVAFRPTAVEVRAGTEVRWAQQDPAAVHTVTSGTVDTDPTGATTPHPDGRFDSGPLEEGGDFSVRFAEPGTYPYFCTIHQATMRGEVRVR